MITEVQRVGMMSSLRSDWRTPYRLFAELETEFKFGLDACADHSNALCEVYMWEHSLNRDWIPVDGDAVWCNPPYGKTIGKWIEKGHREARIQNTSVVMLLPSRTDTLWFHDYCMKGEIRFLKGRLCFDGDRKKRAPFPSMIVIFRGA